jgi:hypothetical protein
MSSLAEALKYEFNNHRDISLYNLSPSTNNNTDASLHNKSGI